MYTFEHISQLIEKVGSEVSAAEVHGIQTGIFCGKQNDSSFEWLPILFAEFGCEGSIKESDFKNLVQVLQQMYWSTSKQLKSISFSFQPLLPGDMFPIGDRVIALADWCRGFLCGLALGGVKDSNFTKSTKESISDISKISNVEIEEDTERQEQEKYYLELVEYIRVVVHGVQMDLDKVEKIKKKVFEEEFTIH